MPLSMRVSIECLPITCKARDLENGRHALNDGGPKMNHEKLWHDNLMSSYAQGDEGAEVAMNLLRRTCGRPSASDLGEAISSLIDVPLTISRIGDTESRIQSFATVMSAVLCIRSEFGTGGETLRSLAYESLVVLMAATAMSDGTSLDETEQKRLVYAVSRIHEVMDLCGISGECF